MTEIGHSPEQPAGSSEAELDANTTPSLSSSPTINEHEPDPDSRSWGDRFKKIITFGASETKKILSERDGLSPFSTKPPQAK